MNANQPNAKMDREPSVWYAEKISVRDTGMDLFLPGKQDQPLTLSLISTYYSISVRNSPYNQEAQFWVKKLEKTDGDNLPQMHQVVFPHHPETGVITLPKEYRLQVETAIDFNLTEQNGSKIGEVDGIGSVEILDIQHDPDGRKSGNSTGRKPFPGGSSIHLNQESHLQFRTVLKMKFALQNAENSPDSPEGIVIGCWPVTHTGNTDEEFYNLHLNALTEFGETRLFQELSNRKIG